MSWRLPPLNAARAFEAVGRTASLTAAAHELGVTVGAISRQVHILEDFVRAELMTRNGRGLVLTQTGRQYAALLSSLFGRLDQESRLLFPTAQTTGLIICSSPAIAMRWLAPRLGRFKEAHPTIDVHLRTLTNPPSVVGERFDLAVTTGPGPWPNLVSHKLFESPMVPVCSPRFAANNPVILEGRLPSSEILIHATDRRNDWTRWSTTARRSDVDASKGMKFENSNLAYQAAIAGMGLMIAHRPLIEADLVAERLLMPFDVSITDEPAYYLLHAEDAERRGSLGAFRGWLLAEAHATARAAGLATDL